MAFRGDAFFAIRDQFQSLLPLLDYSEHQLKRIWYLDPAVKTMETHRLELPDFA